MYYTNIELSMKFGDGSHRSKKPNDRTMILILIVVIEQDLIGEWY